MSRSRQTILRFDLDGAAAMPFEIGHVESTYVTMRDGVKLALDVSRPLDKDPSTGLDTILIMTRYWRGIKGRPSNHLADQFVPHGYAVVVGDVRGTGASFGVWPLSSRAR
ncbi:CocE/NonD family hydrolase [Mesorhizobium sp. M0227]|uniref:CocE/NonD family hydrolase n=1 Tax=Mesorhizobium sp. M0227 TaxID=2956922 RepID=UPI003337DBA2